MYDNLISVVMFFLRHKRLPNLFPPLSLTEKILKIKLRNGGKNHNLRKLIADRISVREYVLEKSLDCKLIELLWCGEVLDEKTWSNLPKKFVIKANHGSKMVKIVNKQIDSFKEISSLCQKWLEIDYYKKGREWVYKDIKKQIIIEEFIEISGEVPPDYKFFCLNGVVRFVQVDLDRYNAHSRNIYSPFFELLDVKYHFKKGGDIEKPKLFDVAKKIAEDLSVDLDFIRVDLYILDEDVYFGELTNFPGNCLEKFSPIEFDFQMGGLLKLDE